MGLNRVSSLHQDYDGLVYVLFDPSGTNGGWHPYIMNTGINSARRGTVTNFEFYRYRFQIRALPSDYPSHPLYVARSWPAPALPLDVYHLGGRLFQQWVVDMFCKVEEQRLMWLRNNQREIRADLYNNVQEAILDNDAASSGRRLPIILPGSFIGSSRDTWNRYMDAMAMTRQLGLPHFFCHYDVQP